MKISLSIITFIAVLIAPYSNKPKVQNKDLIKVGKHNFTLQWIGWDYPGSVNITKKDKNTYYVKGQQLSRENDDYITIDGTLTALSKKELIFNGTIKYLVSYINSGKVCIRNGKEIFKARGKRKNCEGGMVTDYIDIYFN